jgi:hypothetical protein
MVGLAENVRYVSFDVSSGQEMASEFQQVLIDLFSGIGTTVIESGEVIALLAVSVTIGIFTVQSVRANRVERQENYLRLELASNDVFRFEANNADTLFKFRDETSGDAVISAKDELVADAFYYMTLNLFEISMRFRLDGTIDKNVFGSWVVWYYDTLTSWRFRERWPSVRENYTTDLRRIFDDPVAKFDASIPDKERKQKFFNHVASVLNCDIIKRWLSR